MRQVVGSNARRAAVVLGLLGVLFGLAAGVAAQASWTGNDLTLSTQPPQRHRHSAVWTGTGMIVWGGALGTTGVYNSGGSYDPSTNTWTTLPNVVNSPSGRSNHTAVWTGTKMLVWGGKNLASSLNTGSVYDSTTDTWTAMSTTGAPTARFDHTAVWTGSVMVVWGGNSGDGLGTPLNSGGRYDPVTDTWSAVTTSGAPAARDGHIAVWTGTRMVVWGGVDTPGQVLYGGGAMYDPVANTWTAMTQSGAPAARQLHSAVWTGTRVLIWGGFGSSGPVLTGAQFNPATGSFGGWVSMTSTNAPSARYQATATFDGTRMIVWGGIDAVNARLNTGAMFDTQTSTWSAIPTTNAPSGRRNHTAVWTGSRLLVFGGEDGTAYLEDGGVLKPTPTSNSAPTLLAPTGTAITFTPSGNGYGASFPTGSNLAFTLTAAVLDSEDTLTLSVTATGSLTPASAGFIESFTAGVYADPLPGVTQHLLTFSGLAAASGGLTFTVSLSDGNGATASQVITLSITNAGGAPAFTATPAVTATVGVLYTYAAAANGTPAPTIAFSGLPAWLGKSGDTISGTPGTTDVGTTGTITVTATNGVNPDATIQFTITVAAPPFAPQDVNRNGQINVVDVQLCVNIILQVTAPTYQGQGDANASGGVNVVDVQNIVNKILNP